LQCSAAAEVSDSSERNAKEARKWISWKL